MRRPSQITITPEAIETAVQRIDAAILGRGAILLEPGAALDLAPYLRVRSLAIETGNEDEPRPYEQRRDVAIVTIDGPLAQREVKCWSMQLLDGYDAIERRAADAMSADDVGAVVLRIDSPGGDAAGCLELVDALAGMAAEAGKPLVSYADEMAASAAYWIASAGSIVIPRSGIVGSIGTVCAGINEAGAMDKAGLRAIIAAYPSGKAAGWAAQFKPLDAPLAIQGLARMQERAEAGARLFAGDVAARRGTTIDAILALDAAMFSGQAAIDAGLADHVGGMGVAINLARSRIKRKAYSMSQSKQDGSAAALVSLLAIGGLPTEGPAQSQEAVEAATKRAAELAALGAKVEAMTGQSGAAAEGLVSAWQEGAARVPVLERRVKVESLMGRLAAKVPPAQAWAIGADGIPDPKAGPSEEFDRMSLAVFDAKTEAGIQVHPATLPPPKAAADTITPDVEASAKAIGVKPEFYKRAQQKWKD